MDSRSRSRLIVEGDENVVGNLSRITFKLRRGFDNKGSQDRNEEGNLQHIQRSVTDIDQYG